MRYTALAAALVLAGCQMTDTMTDAYLEEVRVGQGLEQRCKTTGDLDDCAAFQAFKSDFEVDGGTPWELAWKG